MVQFGLGGLLGGQKLLTSVNLNLSIFSRVGQRWVRKTGSLKKMGTRITPLRSLERILYGELVTKGIAEKPSRECWGFWRLARAGSGPHPKDWRDKGKNWLARAKELDALGSWRQCGPSGRSWYQGRRGCWGQESQRWWSCCQKGLPQEEGDFLSSFLALSSFQWIPVVQPSQLARERGHQCAGVSPLPYTKEQKNRKWTRERASYQMTNLW